MFPQDQKTSSDFLIDRACASFAPKSAPVSTTIRVKFFSASLKIGECKLLLKTVKSHLPPIRANGDKIRQQIKI